MIFVKLYFGIIYSVISIVIGTYGGFQVNNIKNALDEAKKHDCNKEKSGNELQSTPNTTKIKNGIGSVYNLTIVSLVVIAGGYFGY